MGRALPKAGIRTRVALLVLAFLFTIMTGYVSAEQAPTVPIPKVSIGVEQSQNPQDISTTMQVLLFITLISLAPSLLIMVTSFTRIIIVLGFVRNALGTQQMPPTQILVGLALFMTFFVMAPVFGQINDTAIKPYTQKKITYNQAYDRAVEPLRTFMFKQTREKDLALFIHLSKTKRPKTPADVPTYVLIPSFIISEVRAAFIIGFLIYIPFLIIDVVVASILMSMGMLMVPPVMLSLPLKILLFVLVDGWHLITRALIMGYG